MFPPHPPHIPRTAAHLRFEYAVGFLLLIALILVAPLAAQPSPSENPQSPPAPAEEKAAATKEEAPAAERAPPPPAAGPDTVWTRRGSVLNGELQGVSGGKVQFHDRELGSVNLPGGSIDGVRLKKGFDPLEVYVQRSDRTDVESAYLRSDELGRLLLGLREDEEWTWGELDPGNIHRLQLTSFTRVPPQTKMNGRLLFSLATTDGNTRTLTYGSNGSFALRHPWHIVNARYNAAYAETHNVRSAQRARFDGDYNYMFAPTVGLLYRQSVEHDDFRRIRHASVSALGLSAFLFQRETFTLKTDVGISYTDQDGKRGGRDREFAGLQLGMRAEWKVDPKVSFSANGQGNSVANFSFKNLEDFDMVTDVAANFQVFEKLTLAILFHHDYDSRPPLNFRHVPPKPLKQNNYRLEFQIGWSFDLT